MFVIDRSKNLISRLPVPTFSALGIKERRDFQEWLANTPDALGEEFLIIQKEFAGFEGTRDRFDLLALDKEGSLVIIENKLDDSGSGVVWQVLKYVAYCSSLKKSQIVDIFQDYLKQQHREGNASNIICKFLEADALEEVILNSGSGQRLILVAANFRKEVTSAILWLISNGIRAQCMKVTPYALNGIHLLDIKQIIPPPEAKDYMIGMSSKASEEKEAKTVALKHRQLRWQFWEKTLAYFQTHELELYSNVGPSESHWLNTGAGGRGCIYTMIFGQSVARVDFVIKGSEKEESKRIFDFFHGKKQEIEDGFGSSLDWMRPDEKKTGRIQFSKNFDGYDEGNWQERIEWLFENIQKLERTFKPLMQEIPG